MPETDDKFCVPCFLIFCIIAAAIVILLKCIQVACNRNRREAHCPDIVVAAELVDLDGGGNKIVVNPDGEMMAAIASPPNQCTGVTP